MICPYKCIHCNKRLKINPDAFAPQTKYPLKQWDCPRCKERVIVGKKSSLDYSRFCVSYQKTPESLAAGTNELYAIEFNIDEYRILLRYEEKDTHISKRTKDLLFTTAGAMPAWIYKELVTIHSIVDFDLTDKESITNKIRLLLTFS